MTRSPDDSMTRSEPLDYRARLRKLSEVLDQCRLDALLVTHLPNIRYLCGFSGSAGVLIAADGRSTFFTDGRYREQARSEAKGVRIVVPRGPVLDAAARSAAGAKVRTIGVESDHLALSAGRKVAAIMRPAVRVRQTSAIVEEQRMVKQPAEVERLRAAARLGSRLFEKVLPKIRPGVAETSVAAELEYAARAAGAERMSFDTIVAAGERSALVHGRASAQPVPRRGFVVLDFGVILAGYCSDMTRTVYVGQPGTADRKLYQAVREAQEAALEAVRPGRPVGEVDRAARSVLRRAGYARYFTHSTGHGVGLEIHEAPRLAAEQKEILQPGMVITIEPGAYIPGYGGVRIEDTVVVTENGCEVLTPTTKELLAL